MTDMALERARLRDMRHALAGESIVVEVHGSGDALPVENLARHLPPPYKGDIEALAMIWGRWPNAQQFIDSRIFAYAMVNVGTQEIVSVALRFDGLSDLVCFVRYLDSLEEPPVVKCAKCKQWVPRREAKVDSTFWHYVYYCRGCLAADPVLDNFVQQNAWRFPLPAKGGRGL